MHKGNKNISLEIKDVITEVKKIQNEMTKFGKRMTEIEQRISNEEDVNTVLREMMKRRYKEVGNKN